MNICPKSCITMCSDKEGFLYPQVDNRLCLECGACVRVCPINSTSYKKTLGSFVSPETFAVKHLDDKVRQHSTSGGIFTALSDKVLEMGGRVCGAVFDRETQKVKHVIVKTKEERNLIRGSKYVQSELNEIFKEIKSLLINRQYVLFTGTPCQCAGLLSFLKKDYPNLLVVDIFCHSVPSPLIFQKAKGNDIVDNVRFRDKKLGWRQSYGLYFEHNGKKLHNSTYLTMFFKGLINRPSCHTCHFTNTIRPSDITIGDYWNIQTVDKTFEDKLGVSCVLVNTPKGKKWFESILPDVKYLNTDLSPAIQECLQRPVSEFKARKQFWHNYEKFGYEWCVDKYGHKTIWEIIRDNYLAPIVRKLPIRNVLRKLR